jgi:hypothetical protein
MGPTEILLGVAFPIVIGVGVALALSDASATEFWVARGCFIVAGLEVLGFAFVWLRTVDWSAALRVSLAAAIGFIVIGAIFGSISWVDFREGRQNISFQKYALFWVGIDKDVYQLGTVAKFVNLSEKAYLVDALSFDELDWSFYPRGSYLIQRMLATVCSADLIGDNYLKPNGETYFKSLLPIKLYMTVNGGDSPELIIRGNWNLRIDDDLVKRVPRLYSVYPQFISPADWDALRTSKASVQVDDLHFKPIPPRPPKGDHGPYVNYLVYNSDRTATIDNVYFGQTPAIKGSAGVMLFIRGNGEPPLGIGWSVLGHTYYEVWADPQKLALYNSLFPPGDDGLPRAFGFFAGSENEMAGPVGRPLAAPTTRTAEILEITKPCDGK